MNTQDAIIIDTSSEVDSDPDSSVLGTYKQKSLLQTISLWLKDSFIGKSSDTGLKETLEELIEENEEKNISLDGESKEMLENIISFGQMRVYDVMTPRVNIVAVPENASIEELRTIIINNEHTRMPVYRGNLDDVIGFIHIKDLIRYFGDGASFNISNVIRQILVVPPSMRVIDLLLKMRLSGVHMALVVDEYGGTDGLVTLEDLFEEIVGDIQDEHDDEDETQKIKKLSNGDIEIDAKLEIEELEDFLGKKISSDDNDFDTVGGLIFNIAGKVPVKGEVVEHEMGYSFLITDADNRRINRVRMRMK